MQDSADRVVPPGSRRLWNRLTFRLAAGLLAVGTLTLAGTAWLNLYLQQKHLLGLMEAHADQLAQIILSATRGAMLSNDDRELLQIVETIAEQEGMQRIRIFNREGQISYSNLPAAGRRLSVDEMPCVSCHRYEPPVARLPREERIRVLNGPDGRILEVMAPIANEARCGGGDCHVRPEEQHVLGVLDARLSLASMENDLAASQRELAVGLVLGALVTVAIVGWLTWRLVLCPVGELTAASQLVAAGDLSVRVGARSEDEIGELGRAWNRMAEELAVSRARLEGWGTELEERVEERTAEIKQAQEQMIQVERMASLGRLSAEVAHEINNPLAGIAIYARLMRRKLEGASGGPDSAESTGVDTGARPELTDVLEMIEQEARRCGDIVRNLLLFSRTPAVRVSEVDLASVLERCCMLVQHKASLGEVEMERVFGPGTPTIVGDAAQLEQMILALVVNGIEACSAGDRVEVAITSGETPGWIRIRVRDTGRGIPAENLGKLFEPFFSTKEETSGIGLGLSVVYGIVNRHGGQVAVRSEVDKGTDIVVDLPPRPPEQPEDVEDGSGPGFADEEARARPGEEGQER